LPTELRRHTRGFLARQNGKNVLVEVWTRGRLNDLPPTMMPLGWSYDAILLSPPEYLDSPGPGRDATPEFAGQLLDELDNLLPKKASQARFLVAWSAAESAMRVAALRSRIATDQLSPMSVARELVLAGALSHDQLHQFEQIMAVRNRLAHGVPGDGPRAEQVEFLARIARTLLEQAPVAAAS